MHHPTGSPGAARRAALDGIGQAGELAELRAQVATLTAAVENLTRTPAPVTADSRMDELERRVGSLAAPARTVTPAEMAGLVRRVEHLERIPAPSPVDHTDALADLEQRTLALETLHGLHGQSRHS